MSSQPTQTLYGIQYLRFIAATMVILVHAAEQISRFGHHDITAQMSVGSSGVDIFFVISGFLMCLITFGKNVSTREFLVHRFTRVAAPYWFVTIFMAVLIAVAPSAFRAAAFEWPHFLSSLAFIAWEHPTLGSPLPLYNPGWTLNDEFFFYVLFALFLPLSFGKRIIAVSSVLAGLSLIGLFVTFQNPTLMFYTFPILMEFVMGMGIAYLVLQKNYFCPPIIASILIIIGAISLGTVGFFHPVEHWAAERFLLWGVPAACIVAGVLFLEKSGRMIKSTPLKILGDASYATYITHLFAVGIVGQMWKYLGLKDIFPDFVLGLSCLIAAWVGGLIFHFLIEKNLIRLARKYLSKH